MQYVVLALASMFVLTFAGIRFRSVIRLAFSLTWPYGRAERQFYEGTVQRHGHVRAEKGRRISRGLYWRYMCRSFRHASVHLIPVSLLVISAVISRKSPWLCAGLAALAVVLAFLIVILQWRASAARIRRYLARAAADPDEDLSDH